MTSDDLALLCHSLAEAHCQRRGIPIKTTSDPVALESAHEALDRAEEQLYLDPAELLESRREYAAEEYERTHINVDCRARGDD